MASYLVRTVAAILAMFFAASAQAQAYPLKPITLIVPFAAGASADGIGRVIGRELSKVVGQPVVVDNKPGAGGALGLISVARSAPDGYTIGMGATGAIVINPHLPDAASLKPQQDLMPLAKVADIPLVFVTSPRYGYNNLQAFLNTVAKTESGVSYGTAGQYTAQHLSGELFASMTNANMVAVAYRGSGPAVTDLLGGTLPTAFVDLTSAYPHIKAGKLVALGVTSASRSKVAPDIPTLAEGGVPGYAAPAWMGLFLPSRSPAEVRTALAAALQKVMANPEVQTQIQGLAAEPTYMAPDRFAEFIADESRKWGSVISRLPKPGK